MAEWERSWPPCPGANPQGRIARRSAIAIMARPCSPIGSSSMSLRSSARAEVPPPANSSPIARVRSSAGAVSTRRSHGRSSGGKSATARSTLWSTSKASMVVRAEGYSSHRDVRGPLHGTPPNPVRMDERAGLQQLAGCDSCVRARTMPMAAKTRARVPAPNRTMVSLSRSSPQRGTRRRRSTGWVNASGFRVRHGPPGAHPGPTGSAPFSLLRGPLGFGADRERPKALGAEL